MLGGENFGCGKLLQHAVVGLREAGIKAIIVKSVDRRFLEWLPIMDYGLLLHLP